MEETSVTTSEIFTATGKLYILNEQITKKINVLQESIGAALEERNRLLDRIDKQSKELKDRNVEIDNLESSLEASDTRIRLMESHVKSLEDRMGAYKTFIESRNLREKFEEFKESLEII